MIAVTYVDHAYSAGFLDGEGCFVTTPNSITVKCNHTHLETLKWLQELYGGSISKHDDPSHTKEAWTWAIHAGVAKQCLEKILPFLKEKRGKAKLLIAYRDTVGVRGKKVSQHVLDRREEIREQMRAL